MTANVVYLENYVESKCLSLAVAYVHGMHFLRKCDNLFHVWCIYVGTVGLPSELQRLLTTIGDLDERSQGVHMHCHIC